MSRTPSNVIAERDANANFEKALDKVSRKKSALTRANLELEKAERSFGHQKELVRGIQVEFYPASYWTAEERRDAAADKVDEANKAYDKACEEREEARATHLAALEAVALAAERRYRSLGAAAIRYAR